MAILDAARFRSLSLKSKLIVLMASTSVLALLLASVLLVAFDVVYYRQAMVQDLSAIARMIALSSTAAIAFEDGGSAEEALKSLQSLPGIQYAAIVTENDEPFAVYQKNPEVSFPAMNDSDHQFSRTTLALHAPIEWDGDTVGSIRLVSDLDALYTRIAKHAVAAFMVLMIVSITILIISARAQRIVSEPVQHLVNAARSVSSNRDYSVRVQKRTDDELGTLADAFNEMLMQIQTRDEALSEAYEVVEARVGELQVEVAERKRTQQALEVSENQLRQSQKMEAVGKLAGGVAHDFNNLLTAITGYCNLLLKKLRENDPLRSDVLEIEKAGKRATSLTGQLLAFSRNQVLEPKVLSLNAVVADVKRMLTRVIGEDIELQTLPGTGIKNVKADPGQIEQVLMNLAVNARDAMRRGGRLTVETANVHLDEQYAASNPEVEVGDYVRLAISDSGCGMNQETVARIFEPFYTTKEMGKGTGLGLSTVYGIVKQSGGHITVYSEVGVGTSFTIYLPAVDQGSREISPAKEEAPTGGDETILLVEDEDQVRALAKEILAMHGYRVIEAAHGGEAILLCEQEKEPISLVLTDVVMPQMNGRELYARVSSLHPESQVLYMSGYTDGAIEHHGVLEEGIEFIQKPFTPDGLARRIRNILDEAA